MRILHIAIFERSFPNGVSQSLLGLINKVNKLGHHAAVLPSFPIKGNYKQEQSDINILPGPKRYHFNPWFISDKWFNIIEKYFPSPDIVNFNGIYIPFQTALARLLTKRGLPYIVSPRGSFQPIAQATRGFKKQCSNFLFINDFIKRAKAIHALSQGELLSLQARFPHSRVFLVPNAVDAQVLEFSRYQSENHYSDTKRDFFSLCFVGRIDVFIKGLDLLLGAMKLLEGQRGNLDVKLSLIGPFHTRKDAINCQALIRKLKKPGNVKFLGVLFAQEKLTAISNCDAFIITSRSEGMPNAALEAMALGKPCIVTPGTNMQPTIMQSDGGWVCEASSESIADTLCFILKNRQEIAKKGLNAKEYIRKHLTWDIIAENYLKQIERVLNPSVN